jgi:hypothetical protein
MAHGFDMPHPRPSSYLMAGVLARSALTAAEMGDLAHSGDLLLLDDVEFGYPRFSGTTKWDPEHLTKGLGADLRFPNFQMYKPYPHCWVITRRWTS